MTTHFVPRDESPDNADLILEIEDVEVLYPWAEFIVECEGGWMCFSHVSEYETWKKQT